MASPRFRPRSAAVAILWVFLALIGSETGPAAMAAETSAKPPALFVGAAKVDISPRAPVRLMGYAARAQSPAPTNVAQRLFARALAIGEGRQASVVVTLDNCILPHGVSEAIRTRLVESEGLERDRIALTVTHTHSAPCLSGAAPNIFAQTISSDDQAQIDAYTRFFIDSVATAVHEALQHRRPARLAWGQGRADFAQNRRTPGGPVDPSLPVLRATDADGTLVAVLTSYACHCTTLSGEFNASHGDWAGVAAAAIEDAHPGSVGLVAIGCGADANPAPRGTLALAEQHGRSLATEVERLIGLPLEPLSTAPQCRLESIEIPFRPHFTREQWEQRAKTSGIVGFHARRWNERLDRGENPRPTLPYPVQTFTFATNLAMVFLGGEVVVDYALRLKTELDPRRLWIHGYANEVPGYIPSRRILKEGGYEAESSLWYYDQPQQFDPALEDRIIDAVHRQLPPAFQPPKPRGEMTEPLPAHRALESFRLPPGWTVDLVAGDDLVQSPVAIDFGADGRLWVCEMADYPNGLRGGLEPGGRVKVLTDTEGDGRRDRAEVVADGLPFPTGLMAWKDGVLVCAAPEIRWVRPGQATGEVLFSGFATHNYQARVNGLRWGLDGWVYGAGGLFGGQIHSHRAGTDTDARQRDFRFLPESGEFQALPGVSQQGRVRDDFGEWFGNDNGSLLWHVPLPAAAATHGVEPVQARIPSNRDDHRVFPTSPTLERFNDPHTANHLT
ncbi:MAG: neutral/alkaline non-lysosomal ceramidase N-terminal domain-containing protein, partial [Verrucomicrobiota bacterium]